MLRLVLITGVLVVHSLANADFRVTPPKGWKPDIEEAGVAREASEMLERMDPTVKVKVAIWTSPDALGRLEVTHYLFRRPGMQPDTLLLTDQLTDAHLGTPSLDGAKVIRRTNARRVKNEFVTELTMQKASTPISLVGRVRRPAADEIEVLLVVCTGHSKVCAKALASSALRPSRQDRDVRRAVEPSSVAATK